MNVVVAEPRYMEYDGAQQRLRYLHRPAKTRTRACMVRQQRQDLSFSHPHPKRKVLSSTRSHPMHTAMKLGFLLHPPPVRHENSPSGCQVPTVLLLLWLLVCDAVVIFFCPIRSNLSSSVSVRLGVLEWRSRSTSGGETLFDTPIREIRHSICR